MKKIALFSALVVASIVMLNSPVEAASYEPTYPARCCDYQGFDNCVNYNCTRPKPNQQVSFGVCFHNGTNTSFIEYLLKADGHKK